LQGMPSWNKLSTPSLHVSIWMGHNLFTSNLQQPIKVQQATNLILCQDKAADKQEVWWKHHKTANKLKLIQGFALPNRLESGIIRAKLNDVPLNSYLWYRRVSYGLSQNPTTICKQQFAAPWADQIFQFLQNTSQTLFFKTFLCFVSSYWCNFWRTLKNTYLRHKKKSYLQ
jgi:hypothetical protein